MRDPGLYLYPLTGGNQSWDYSPQSHSQPDPNRFGRDRLFSAVARGAPEDLAGLPEYLRRTSKYLTDSEYRGRLPLEPGLPGWVSTMVRS